VVAAGVQFVNPQAPAVQKLRLRVPVPHELEQMLWMIDTVTPHAFERMQKNASA